MYCTTAPCVIEHDKKFDCSVLQTDAMRFCIVTVSSCHDLSKYLQRQARTSSKHLYPLISKYLSMAHVVQANLERGPVVIMHAASKGPTCAVCFLGLVGTVGNYERHSIFLEGHTLFVCRPSLRKRQHWRLHCWTLRQLGLETRSFDPVMGKRSQRQTSFSISHPR